MTLPVQLGWMQTAINYVFDKVLNPLFSWASELLSDAFKWLFNTILGPLLESAFSLIMQTVGKYVMRIIGRQLYHIEEGFLLILDMLQKIFDVLAGISPVSDTETKASGSLLSVLVRTPFVTKTMLIVISISIVLCVLFAIVATIRSIGEMGGPQSRPVGQVLRRTAQAMLRMIAAPLMGLFLVVLGDAILLAITNAMTLDENVTIARSLFVISTLDAVDDEFGAVDKYGVKHEGGQRLELSFKNQYVSASTQIGDWNNPILAYNYSTRPTYLASHPGEGSDYGLRDLYREPFYTGKKDYSSSVDVDATFNVGRLDYLIGIGGALLFIFILGTAMFNFVSRLFDVIILLIVEPFFIAPMPLDDGEHFKKWEELFIGKLFSGYGMVVAMYVYLLVCTIVFDGRLAFTARDGMGDIMMDMLMRMLILIGGAATVMTAGPLVTSILSSVAAEQEGASNAAGMAFTGAVMDYGSKPARALMGYGMDKLTDGIADKIKSSIANAGQKFDNQKKDSDTGGLFPGAGGGSNSTNVPNAPINPEGTKPGSSMSSTIGEGSSISGTGTGSVAPSDVFTGGRTESVSTTAGSVGGGDNTSAGGGGGQDLFAQNGGDDFDTVFDVGGKSLFDQDNGGASMGDLLDGGNGGDPLHGVLDDKNGQ
ncbi:MAG: hypothetical protein K6G16_01510 [Lachnospiraceae bacterium]|nr:hypothetical protein [Lachnospiraceae bacterium]